MKRQFLLKATYGQETILDFSVTISQVNALPHTLNRDETLAAIVRANWSLIKETMLTYECPGFTRESMWHEDERLAGVEDIETGIGLTFTATPQGPRFTHEIVSAGASLYLRQ